MAETSEETPFQPGTRRSGSKSAFLPDYSFDLTAFSLKPHTLRLFTRRRSLPYANAYARSSEGESEAFGANLALKDKALP